jgi:hypothetical protein
MVKRRPASKRNRRIIASAASIAALAVVITAMCLPIYAPADDHYDIHRIDAVFVLGPPTDDRLAKGDAIARAAGGVPVYVSAAPRFVCPPQDRCVRAVPWTTVGEAAALTTIMRTDGIRHPLVVTSSVHLMRARYIFGRCVPGYTPIVGVRRTLQPWDDVWQPIYQWSAMVKAMIGGCVGTGG